MRGLVLVLTAVLAACSTGPSTGAPSESAGVIAGKLVAQRSDGSDRVAVAGERIGVFTEAVIPGKVLQHPPSPIATTVTSGDGGFAFHGLQPGRYFVTEAVAGSLVSGHWVILTPERGASVQLVRCTDCPTPR
jgi:hypothetical protein